MAEDSQKQKARMDPEVMDYYDGEVVESIVGKYGYGEREALELFLGSKTYRMLCDPEMSMWDFGPPAIENAYDDLDDRLAKAGVPPAKGVAA